ncbi:MAG TPA: rhomboid family intramembrane serine protease [Rudaea sp.]|nr:rhomboid family intramembrane serine protease [Rudaea sp.]
MTKLPPVTAMLLIANVAIFLLQQVAGDTLIWHFALWPLGPHQLLRLGDGSVVSAGFEVWQLITYGFLHGGLAHIAFNMFALWMFGAPVENVLGTRKYAFYYVSCVLGAAVAQLATLHFFQSENFYPTLGASGGVFGLLLAFAVLYPHAKVFLFFIPAPIPARIAVVGYMAIELYLGITGTQAGVAHFAHLGGAVVGFALIQYWRTQARARGRP